MILISFIEDEIGFEMIIRASISRDPDDLFIRKMKRTVKFT
jgi:hypothetical protein